MINNLDTIRGLSPNVDNYFTNKLYLPGLKDTGLEDLDMEDKLTSAFNILIDELNLMGIIVEDRETVLSSTIRREMVFNLRRMFSMDNLITSYSNLSKEVRDILTSFREVTEVVKFFHINYPMSLLYQSLYDNSDLFTSDDRFEKYFQTIISAAPVDDYETNPDILIPYLKDRAEHLKLVREATAPLLKIYHQVNRQYIEQMLRVHDHDKTEPDKLRAFAFIFKKDEDNDEFLYEKNHHLNNNHHIEYYEARDLQLDDTSVFLIAADLYGYAHTRDELLTKAKKLLEKHELLRTREALFLDMIKHLDYGDV